ncbi:MAG: hypothetical protein HRU18_01640 [Pseudoalteromonas sp.]|uniref:hypothetical protein n=1 Tax=Pseudoalteromonas sp. TaxID=53249 RepID=UPI001D31B5CA|nr:hypothetical protein [Pseudoalteromonas sp.]NRA76884.1 hypothetical protein [Pseudoalteromonas sp.]
MSDQIINPSSVSFEDVQADLLKYADAQPDNEKWDVFFQSSGGYQIIEYISALRAVIKYDNLVAKRENFIQFAKNRSSKIGASQFLGYSAFRGQNAIVDVTYVPRGSGVHSAYDIIGTVKEVDLIVLEETAYNAGVEITVRCMIGEVGEETRNASSDRLDIFKFRTPNISNTLKVYIEGQEVTTTEDVVALLEGSAQVQTNPFGSVDVKYLNLSTFFIRYNTGGEVKIKFIKLKDVDFQLSDVQLDEAEGTLTDLVLVSLFEERETDKSIEINAPLRNETKLHVRGRRDNEKVLLQLDSSLISAKGADIAGAKDGSIVEGTMAVYYLKADETRYTPDEKVTLLDRFQAYRPNGLLPPIISEPHRALRKFKVIVYRVPNTTGDIIAKIDEVFAQYEYKLGGKINLHDIEAELESESYIKVARVSYESDLWESNRGYVQGAQVKTVGSTLVYEVTKQLYRSGSTEPVWPEIAQQTIFDNGLIWQAFVKDDVSEMVLWNANTPYAFRDKVRPATPNGLGYRVIGFANYSGALEPIWPILDGRTVEEATGDLVYDGNLIWRAMPLEGTPNDWTAEKNYLGGEVVVPTDPATGDVVGLMYQVFGFTRNSGSTLPTFPTNIDEQVEDGDLIWTAKDPLEVEVELPESQYYVIETLPEIK